MYKYGNHQISPLGVSKSVTWGHISVNNYITDWRRMSLSVLEWEWQFNFWLDVTRPQLEPVHQTVGDARPACPGVDVGTLLARPHVPHAGLVPQVTHLRLVAPRGAVLDIESQYTSHVVWPHLVITLEGFEGLDVLQRRGLPHPLYGLPGCHHPDVLHRDDRVQEQLKPLLVVRRGKPDKNISFPVIVIIIALQNDSLPPRRLAHTSLSVYF